LSEIFVLFCSANIKIFALYAECETYKPDEIECSEAATTTSLTTIVATLTHEETTNVIMSTATVESSTNSMTFFSFLINSLAYFISSIVQHMSTYILFFIGEKTQYTTTLFV